MAHAPRMLRQVRQLAHHDAADAALLARYAAGRDDQAFAALVGRHAGLVHGVCRRILNDPATFLLLARRAGRIHRPEALAAWLHETARNLALSHCRHEARRRRRETAAARPEASRDPLDEITLREFLRIFDDEVGRLPESYRLPLLLCGLEGCTVAEAARRLGWTTGAVRGRLERARATLQGQLRRRGLEQVPQAAVGVPAGFVARTLGPASPAALAIADAGLRGATMMKAGLAVALLAGVLTVGVLTAARPGGSTPTVAALVAATPPKLDRHGDPLPDGAVVRLGTVRWRTPGSTTALAYTPDGTALVATSSGGITLFDAAGRRTKQIPTPGVRYSHFRVLPDGKQVACVGRVTVKHRDREVVHVWNLPTGRKVHDFDVTGSIWCGLTPAGEPLAISLTKDGIRLRELRSGKTREFAASDRANVRDITCASAYAPAAQVLAVFDGRSRVHVWDVATGKNRCTLDLKEYSRSLVITPDGNALATLTHDGNDTRGIRIWDLTTGALARTIPAHQYCHALGLSQDGKTLAAINWQSVRFHELATGRELGRAKGGPLFDGVSAFAPDGKTLATAERQEGAIHRWEVATGDLRPVPPGHIAVPSGIDFTPDGSRLAATDRTQGVRVWDTATGEQSLQARNDNQYIYDCRYSADGRTLLTLLWNATIEFRDAATGRPAATVQPPAAKGGRSLHLSADRNTLLALTDRGEERQLTGWDVATRARLFHRRRPANDFGLAVSPDLEVLAASQPDWDKDGDEIPGGKPIRLENLRTGEHLLDLPYRERQTSPLGFSPDGRSLVTNTSAQGPPDQEGRRLELVRTLRLWEWQSASEVREFPSCSNARAAFSPDGRLLALKLTKQEIVLWDLRRGREVTRFTGFDTEVWSLAFSPDGRRLVSGLADTSILVWAVPAVPKAAALDASGLRQAWADLAGDAAPAFRARGALADSPAAAIALLRERLKPAAVVPAEDVRRLLADLDNDRAAVRQAAKAKLEELGDRAAEPLRQALAAKPSAEVKRQAEALLERLRGPVKGEVARAVRAVAVLEDIDTQESRKLLEVLAAGAAGARLTAEAKAALARRPR